MIPFCYFCKACSNCMNILYIEINLSETNLILSVKQVPLDQIGEHSSLISIRVKPLAGAIKSLSPHWMWYTYKIWSVSRQGSKSVYQISQLACLHLISWIMTPLSPSTSKVCSHVVLLKTDWFLSHALQNPASTPTWSKILTDFRETSNLIWIFWMDEVQSWQLVSNKLPSFIHAQSKQMKKARDCIYKYAIWPSVSKHLPTPSLHVPYRRIILGDICTVAS